MQFADRFNKLTETEIQDPNEVPTLQSNSTNTGDLAQILGKSNIAQLNIYVNQTNLGTNTYKARAPIGTVYTNESAAIKMLITFLKDMQQSTDDPLEYEQSRAIFLEKMRELREAKYHREIGFTDLLTMLDIAITYSEPSKLTEKAFDSIREAIYALSLEINNEDLSRFRSNFRESNIDILRPMKERDNLSSDLKELFE